MTLIFNSSTVDKTSAADMSERLAPDNVVMAGGDAAVVAGDAAAVAAEDCRSTALTDAHCKVEVSSCTAAFDYIQRLMVAPNQHSEWEIGYRQRDLKTAATTSLKVIK